MAHDDKYLNDPTAWFQNAQNVRSASAELFRSGNPFKWFPAALLGHHALEMFLKAALIRQGHKIEALPKETYGVMNWQLLGTSLLPMERANFPLSCLESCNFSTTTLATFVSETDSRRNIYRWTGRRARRAFGSCNWVSTSLRADAEGPKPASHS
jgi:hypothetical protein